MAERDHRAQCGGSKADNRQDWARVGGGREGPGSLSRVGRGWEWKWAWLRWRGTGESTSCLEQLVQGAQRETWGQGAQWGSWRDSPVLLRWKTRQFLFLSRAKQNWISRSMAMKNKLQIPIRKPKGIRMGWMEIRWQGWQKKTRVAA